MNHWEEALKRTDTTFLTGGSVRDEVTLALMETKAETLGQVADILHGVVNCQIPDSTQLSQKSITAVAGAFETLASQIRAAATEHREGQP